jgi:DNA-binding transcriptional MerR regulator
MNSIRQISKKYDVPAYNLRYWESTNEIPIAKRVNNHRYWDNADLPVILNRINVWKYTMVPKHVKLAMALEKIQCVCSNCGQVMVVKVFSHNVHLRCNCKAWIDADKLIG